MERKTARVSGLYIRLEWPVQATTPGHASSVGYSLRHIWPPVLAFHSALAWVRSELADTAK